MAEYGFIEGLYFPLPHLGERENASLQTTIDCHLSLDMANVLAMVEKNAKAVARWYFIDCESRLLMLRQIWMLLEQMKGKRFKESVGSVKV